MRRKINGARAGETGVIISASALNSRHTVWRWASALLSALVMYPRRGDHGNR
jgi:hypothetical protein